MISKSSSLTESSCLCESEPPNTRLVSSIKDTPCKDENNEDIRDLKIDQIMSDLKSKKLDMSTLKRPGVEERKREIYREEALDMGALNERWLDKQGAHEEFYAEERTKYRDVQKVSFQDMIEANQSDIQILLNDVKLKNKSFLQAIMDD